MSFAFGNPNFLTLDGNTYDLLGGRVFLCEVVNNGIVIEQLKVGVRQRTDPDAVTCPRQGYHNLC